MILRWGGGGGTSNIVDGGALPMILRWGGGAGTSNNFGWGGGGNSYDFKMGWGGGHFQYFWMGGVVHVMQRKSGSRLDMSPL